MTSDREDIFDWIKKTCPGAIIHRGEEPSTAAFSVSSVGIWTIIGSNWSAIEKRIFG